MTHSRYTSFIMTILAYHMTRETTSYWQRPTRKDAAQESLPSARRQSTLWRSVGDMWVQVYFQTTAKDGVCRRILMLHYKTPTLLRHGDVWIYQFPSRRQVTIRCPRYNSWVTHARTLSHEGLIGNATTCSITFGKLRILRELYGATRANLEAPSVYVPEDLPILTRHGLPRVEAALKQR